MQVCYIVSYDVSNNRLRNKVQKVCSKYIQRVQYSVFEGYLSKTGFLKLKRELEELSRNQSFLTTQDSILIYKQCSMCYTDHIILGKEVKSGEHFVVV